MRPCRMAGPCTPALNGMNVPTPPFAPLMNEFSFRREKGDLRLGEDRIMAMRADLYG